MTQIEQKDPFDLAEALGALEATPLALKVLLANLPEPWLDFSEDAEAWSPRTVLVHFIHNEQTNWLTRTRVILSDAKDRSFTPFRQMPEADEYPPAGTDQLLNQFAKLRKNNLFAMREFDIKSEDLDREGEHPVHGTVTLRQLIATWVVHDYNHTHQIAKSLAKRYIHAVGPWRDNLAILDL